VSNPKSARARMGHFRAACTRAGESVPFWAAGPSRAEAAPADLRPATLDELLLTAAVQAGQAFPAELTRWRAAGGVSRIVAVRADGGVQLVEYPDGVTTRRASFPTAADAVAAIASKAIPWRVVPRVKRGRDSNTMHLGRPA
jgi:hypothetical protein